MSKNVKSFGLVSMSQINPDDKYLVAHLDDFYNNQTDLLGKVLTLIDASVSEKTQCKAIKDLVHQLFTENHKNLWCTYLNGKDAEEVGITGGGNPRGTNIGDIR
jgi:hypothetical protein